MAEINPKLERLFASWSQAMSPPKNIATVAQQPRPVVYLIDRPGSFSRSSLPATSRRRRRTRKKSASRR